MASYSPYYGQAVAIPNDAKHHRHSSHYSTHNHSGYPNYYSSTRSSSAYSESPPDDCANQAASMASGVPSVPSYASRSSHSGANSTYAESSNGDWETSASAGGIDLPEYMHNRFADVFDPIPLDKSLARQAQTSGQLNAKHRELVELQAKAQARLARTRARFQEGMQDAQEVRADLEWTSKKVSSMKTRTSRKHPKEYQKARERYPSPEY